MLFHLVPLSRWSAAPEAPYAPASLAAEGFVHCSPDEATALAVADAHYREVSEPLLVLRIDEERLGGVEVRWEGPYPHLYGPVDRAAVVGVLQVRRDADGRAVGLFPRV
jgi:uncharacterized protein (DUF952 family)